MTWSWEYSPSEEFVTDGAPEAFVVEVEKKAEELVRAAEALYLDGSSFQGVGEPLKTATVTNGFFLYFVRTAQRTHLHHPAPRALTGTQEPSASGSSSAATRP
nr:hypothetical protein [Streptomyces sp. 846.5]